MIEGYNARVLIQYRQTRLIMFMIARMMGDPKKGPKKPEELWPLPGDKNSEAMDKDEIAAMFERLRQKEKMNG